MVERVIEYVTDGAKQEAELMRTLADSPAGTSLPLTHEEATRARAADYPWSLAYSPEEFRGAAAPVVARRPEAEADEL